MELVLAINRNPDSLITKDRADTLLRRSELLVCCCAAYGVTVDINADSLNRDTPTVFMEAVSDFLQLSSHLVLIVTATFHRLQISSSERCGSQLLLELEAFWVTLSPPQIFTRSAAFSVTSLMASIIAGNSEVRES